MLRCPADTKLSTRSFLIALMPALSRITPVHRASADAPAAVLLPPRKPPIRALDCGAGVGRVTETVLAHLCDIIGAPTCSVWPV